MFDWIERLIDGTLVSGGVFLIIGIIGAVLLLVSVLLDGLFDVFDFGDGPLSLTSIAAFGTIFGFAAFGSIGAGASTGAAAAIGSGAGLLGGAAAWWLSRLVRGAESNTSITSDELVGSEASVVLAIPAGGLGEVALVRHGERISLAATAAHAIPRGTRVRITQTLTASSVSVELLPDSVDEDQPSI